MKNDVIRLSSLSSMLVLALSFSLALSPDPARAWAHAIARH